MLLFLFVSLANTRPPVLHVNGSLLVPLGGFTALTPLLLQVKDPDSPSQQLVFQIIHGPNNGRLFLLKEMDREQRQELSRDSTFTWTELRAGQVHFKHQKDKARSVEEMFLNLSPIQKIHKRF